MADAAGCRSTRRGAMEVMNVKPRQYWKDCGWRLKDPVCKCCFEICDLEDTVKGADRVPAVCDVVSVCGA